MTRTSELQAIREQKKSSYAVRTRFVDDAGQPRFVNELVAEDSPYLLQHAHNPVHWYAWSRDAFDKAAAEDKPIFLSIGYSTCHWCHVMEEECFDDTDVAYVLNHSFVAIKVDREQRPDLDAFYMTGVQLINGHGGWPMSCFLLPDGKPFFGGTYFPKANFLDLLERVQDVWQTQTEQLRADADRLEQGIRRELAPAAAADLPARLGERAAAALVEHSDTIHGGFGAAPKFPQEPNLMLLAEQVARDERPLGEQPAWTALRGALDAMLAGGIHDQIGGGFHRYATDAAWQVPHFEKMLYNQGQLADVYLAAWQLSGDPAYRDTVETTLDYVIREMQSPEGGFYCATDADSEGEEGRFFVWRYDELADVLDADDLAFCETVFGVTANGNFEGANILHRPQPFAEAAAQLGLSRSAFDARLRALRQRLYARREDREKPLRDDKHIAEWNGMVIASLARAARVLDRADYLAAAQKAAAYIRAVHHDGDGALLWRTSLHGRASVAGQIEDYAHLMDGLVALYDATGDDNWLGQANTLLAEARDRHWDDAAGGFFGPPPQADGPQPMRAKPLVDNATVSGNSLMPVVLRALYERTGEPELRALADDQIAAFSGQIAQTPLAAPVFLKGLWQWQAPTPGPFQYFGGGAIAARASMDTPDAGPWRLRVALSIRDGWHVQAPGDGSENTRVDWINAGAEATPVRVETADSNAAGDTPLRGRATLVVDVDSPVAKPWVVELCLQPCTERECLPAETRRFVLHA